MNKKCSYKMKKATKHGYNHKVAVSTSMTSTKQICKDGYPILHILLSYCDLKFNLIMANIAYFLDTLVHVSEQLCN